MPARGPAPPRAASRSLGISSGRCWPSASSVTTASQPRANSVRKAVTRAAPCRGSPRARPGPRPPRAPPPPSRRRSRRPHEDLGQHLARASHDVADGRAGMERGNGGGDAHQARSSTIQAPAPPPARLVTRTWRGAGGGRPRAGRPAARDRRPRIPPSARTPRRRWRGSRPRAGRAVFRGHGLRASRAEGAPVPQRVQGVRLQAVAGHGSGGAGDDEIDVARGEAGAVEHAARGRARVAWPRPQDTRDALGSKSRCPRPARGTGSVPRVRARRFVLHHDDRRPLAQGEAGAAPVEGARRLASLRGRTAQRAVAVEQRVHEGRRLVHGAGARARQPSPRPRPRRRVRGRAAAPLRAGSP